MSVIEVQNLRKNFGSLEVLRDVSFSVEKGDVVAIIGSSGSGKSTLLRCLIDLETVSGGTIVIDGRTLCRDGAYVSVKEKKAITLGMGMVFQHFNLYPHLSVMQNLEIAPRLVKNRRGSELREQAMDLLTKVGMADRANEMPVRLSGGQKQRVAIAGAIASHKEIIVYDEPTSGLDYRHMKEVSACIQKLSEIGKTQMSITHDPELVANCCDYMVFMDNGDVSRFGEWTDENIKFASCYFENAR